MIINILKKLGGAAIAKSTGTKTKIVYRDKPDNNQATRKDLQNSYKDDLIVLVIMLFTLPYLIGLFHNVIAMIIDAPLIDMNMLGAAYSTFAVTLTSLSTLWQCIIGAILLASTGGTAAFIAIIGAVRGNPEVIESANRYKMKPNKKVEQRITSADLD